jgi:hypothetical protein
MIPSTVESQGQSFIHQRDSIYRGDLHPQVDQVVTDMRGLHFATRCVIVVHCCSRTLPYMRAQMIKLNGLDKDGQAQVPCDNDTLTPFIWHVLLYTIEWFMQMA